MLMPSYDAAPPISAPLRFFLTMPLFGLLLGTGLLLTEPALLASRWSWPVLALTHLLTLGLLAQPMLGALIQILPVVAGVSLPQPVWLARWCHGWLTGGTLALAGGFWLNWPPALQLAAVCLPLALAPFVALALHGLWRRRANDATSRLLLLALLALLMTLGLGATLLAHLGWGRGLDAMQLTNLHALWGSVGWLFGLVAGVAQVVVPMFQQTPRYPAWLEKYAPWLLLGCLLAGSALLCWPQRATSLLLTPLLLLCAAGFALLTLKLQRQSRRASDVTLRFWLLGMACLLLAALLLLPPLQDAWPPAGLLAGAVFFYGFAVSLVCGMLYKIVPFLVWLHLQRLNRRRFAIPNMKQVIAEPLMQWQLRLHAVSLLLLLSALAWPAQPGSVLAGMAVLASQALLGWNLLAAARLYRNYAARIALADPAG